MPAALDDSFITFITLILFLGCLGLAWREKVFASQQVRSRTPGCSFHNAIESKAAQVLVTFEDLAAVGAQAAVNAARVVCLACWHPGYRPCWRWLQASREEEGLEIMVSSTC